ncbi:DUF4411 family protein [Corynebacterium guaraldiae]|uniref:DUF4411 family protein n=1 Tax=Corynebacterium guaraldiae TaxID=3051103 RepID=UPI003D697322
MQPSSPRCLRSTHISYTDPSSIANPRRVYFPGVRPNFQRKPRFDEAAVQEFLNDAADSWLVASAHARDLSIITDEKPQPRRVNRVKLPDAAAALGVRCSTYLDFLRSRGITY